METFTGPKMQMQPKISLRMNSKGSIDISVRSKKLEVSKSSVSSALADWRKSSKELTSTKTEKSSLKRNREPDFASSGYKSKPSFLSTSSGVNVKGSIYDGDFNDSFLEKDPISHIKLYFEDGNDTDEDENVLIDLDQSLTGISGKWRKRCLKRAFIKFLVYTQARREKKMTLTIAKLQARKIFLRRAFYNWFDSFRFNRKLRQVTAFITNRAIDLLVKTFRSWANVSKRTVRLRQFTLEIMSKRRANYLSDSFKKLAQYSSYRERKKDLMSKASIFWSTARISRALLNLKILNRNRKYQRKRLSRIVEIMNLARIRRIFRSWRRVLPVLRKSRTNTEKGEQFHRRYNLKKAFSYLSKVHLKAIEDSIKSQLFWKIHKIRQFFSRWLRFVKLPQDRLSFFIKKKFFKKWFYVIRAEINSLNTQLEISSKKRVIYILYNAAKYKKMITNYWRHFLLRRALVYLNLHRKLTQLRKVSENFLIQRTQRRFLKKSFFKLLDFKVSSCLFRLARKKALEKSFHYLAVYTAHARRVRVLNASALNLRRRRTLQYFLSEWRQNVFSVQLERYGQRQRRLYALTMALKALGRFAIRKISQRAFLEISKSAFKSSRRKSSCFKALISYCHLRSDLKKKVQTYNFKKQKEQLSLTLHVLNQNRKKYSYMRYINQVALNHYRRRRISDSFSFIYHRSFQRKTLHILFLEFVRRKVELILQKNFSRWLSYTLECKLLRKKIQPILLKYRRQSASKVFQRLHLICERKHKRELAQKFLLFITKRRALRAFRQSICIRNVERFISYSRFKACFLHWRRKVLLIRKFRNIISNFLSISKHTIQRKTIIRWKENILFRDLEYAADRFREANILLSSTKRWKLFIIAQKMETLAFALADEHWASVTKRSSFQCWKQVVHLERMERLAVAVWGMRTLSKHLYAWRESILASRLRKAQNILASEHWRKVLLEKALVSLLLYTSCKKTDQIFVQSEE